MDAPLQDLNVLLRAPEVADSQFTPLIGTEVIGLLFVPLARRPTSTTPPRACGMGFLWGNDSF